MIRHDPVDREREKPGLFRSNDGMEDRTASAAGKDIRTESCRIGASGFDRLAGYGQGECFQFSFGTGKIQAEWGLITAVFPLDGELFFENAADLTAVEMDEDGIILIRQKPVKLELIQNAGGLAEGAVDAVKDDLGAGVLSDGLTIQPGQCIGVFVFLQRSEFDGNFCNCPAADPERIPADGGNLFFQGRMFPAAVDGTNSGFQGNDAFLTGIENKIRNGDSVCTGWSLDPAGGTSHGTARIGLMGMSTQHKVDLRVFPD